MPKVLQQSVRRGREGQEVEAREDVKLPGIADHGVGAKGFPALLVDSGWEGERVRMRATRPLWRNVSAKGRAMTTFDVKGPFEIGTTKVIVGRQIEKENIKEFWQQNPALENECGCYVFGFRASKGSKPMYVGKTNKSFKQEIFGVHKLNVYHRALGSVRKGKPIVFFVCLKRRKGKRNLKAIDEVESFLIQAASVKNPGLLNSRKRRSASWTINGIIRFRGKTPVTAQKLKQCLGLGK
jgi:hypothetical protein